MNVIILGAGTAGLISALMLREKYPMYNINIIKSGDIGIVGVGEGSTEHWDRFMRYVGINLYEIIYKTKATVKIGILFEEWNKNEKYVHSISHNSISPLGRPEYFNHLYLHETNKVFPLAPVFESVFYKNQIPVSNDLLASNQYHFDTFKLNEYLQELCISRDIVITDCVVTDVIQDTQGNITGLQTLDTVFNGELFIDCSGFKRVISNKVGVKYISKSEYLPMNHAIAFPTHFDTPDHNYEPYTTTTALSSGWMWKIPTQERYGNGYVFSDEYINSDQALGEANKHLGKDIEKVARDIKFTAGKVDKFWHKNVISIGLAGSFAEPLEAQSIGFSIVQVFAMLEYLDQWQYNKGVNEQYNSRMDKCFDNIIDYLQAHYLTKREDTKFWKDKPFKLTDFNEENIPLFKRGLLLPAMFKNDSDLMFTLPNWYQVLGGLKIIDKNELKKSLEKNRTEYNQVQNRTAIELYNKDINGPVATCTHKKYIELVNFNYKAKYEN
jgi:tryptophan halogenase